MLTQNVTITVYMYFISFQNETQIKKLNYTNELPYYFFLSYLVFPEVCYGLNHHR